MFRDKMCGESYWKPVEQEVKIERAVIKENLEPRDHLSQNSAIILH